MKKSNFALVGLYLFAGLAFILAPSCSKKDDVTPTTVAGINITSVTSATISLGNDESSPKEGYLVSTSSKAAITSSFDIAYGNGSAAGNEYFLGGSSDESIKAVYALTGAGAATEFITFGNASGVSSATFDSLTNQLAVAPIYAKGSLSAAATGGLSTRVKSSSAWPVGTVFAFKTSAGTMVIAKVTTAPNGSASTAGTIGLALKK